MPWMRLSKGSLAAARRPEQRIGPACRQVIEIGLSAKDVGIGGVAAVGGGEVDKINAGHLPCPHIALVRRPDGRVEHKTLFGSSTASSTARRYS